MWGIAWPFKLRPDKTVSLQKFSRSRVLNELERGVLWRVAETTLMNRAFGRNVHIYDASDPTKNLGGLIQNGSITQSNFLFIISILIACDKPYDVVERATSLVVAHNDNPINHGDYDIRSAGDIRVTDEPWVKRVLTFAVSGEDMFRTAVRERDGKCVFTGIVNQRAPAGEWSGFAVAHIFPLSAEAYWNQNDFECCVSVVPPHEPYVR